MALHVTMFFLIACTVMAVYLYTKCCIILGDGLRAAAVPEVLAHLNDEGGVFLALNKRAMQLNSLLRLFLIPVGVAMTIVLGMVWRTWAVGDTISPIVLYGPILFGGAITFVHLIAVLFYHSVWIMIWFGLIQIAIEMHTMRQLLSAKEAIQSEPESTHQQYELNLIDREINKIINRRLAHQSYLTNQTKE